MWQCEGKAHSSGYSRARRRLREVQCQNSSGLLCVTLGSGILQDDTTAGDAELYQPQVERLEAATRKGDDLGLGKKIICLHTSVMAVFKVGF